MEDAEFQKVVIGYFDGGQMTLDGKVLQIRSAAWLAPGVLAVHDSANEVDAYFDLDRWQFTSPETWSSTDPTQAEGFRKEMLEKGIAVLPGLGSIPHTRDIPTMMKMAQIQLTHTHSWFDEPVELKLQVSV